MKKITINNLVLILVFAMLCGCEDFDTPVPGFTDFNVWELTTDAVGNVTRGSSITTVQVGQVVELEVLTDADLATIWPGDFNYRPFGTDSVLNSRNYVHYGELGAEGVRMNFIDGGDGFSNSYSWPEAGTFNIVVVLTNHGTDGLDFEQLIIRDFSVEVVN